MNYEKLSAIQFVGDFEVNAFKEWFEIYKKDLTVVCFQPDGEAVAIEVKNWAIEKKEEGLKRAIQLGLKPSIRLEGESGEEYSFSFQVVGSEHRILNHHKEDVIGFLSLKEKSVQMFLREIRPDYLVQWSLSLWTHLENHLENQKESIKKVAYDYIIQSCQEMKSKKKTVDEGIEFVRQNFYHVNKKRQKSKQMLHEVEFVFYLTPGESRRSDVYGVMGSGTGVGIAHAILILFVMMQETPMLQEYVLRRFRERAKEI